MASIIVNRLLCQATKPLFLKKLNTVSQSISLTNQFRFISTRDDGTDRLNREKKEFDLNKEEQFTLTNEKDGSRKQDTNEHLRQLGQGAYNGILYPSEITHSALMINGVQYKDLPIINIKTTKNNTILSLTDAQGKVLFSTSAGTVGFKNAKRSTTTAAQAAAIAMGDHIKRRGYTNLRVTIKGLGNGRLVAIKSFQMSGLNIISITDKTDIPLPYLKPQRPPARRKV